MKHKLDDFYCMIIGGASGLATWFSESCINMTFFGSLIRATLIAVVSTSTGLIVKQIWYMIFPYKDNKK